MKDIGFAKFVVLVNGAVPLALLGWDAYWHQLGANPENDSLHITGMTALIFLMLTLTITPVRKISGWNWLSHFRRMLGLYAFFYACVHLSIYFVLDKSFNIVGLLRDTVTQKYIFFGMTALLLMAPLAATSTNGMIKRLGAARWKRLHQLIYPSAIAAIIHFWLIGKFLGLTLEAFIVALVILLGYRIVAKQLADARKARLLAT